MQEGGEDRGDSAVGSASVDGGHPLTLMDRIGLHPRAHRLTDRGLVPPPPPLAHAFVHPAGGRAAPSLDAGRGAWRWTGQDRPATSWEVPESRGRQTPGIRWTALDPHGRMQGPGSPAERGEAEFVLPGIVGEPR